jgi:hypothetical protein
MASTARNISDHRKRILEHQEAQAKREDAAQQPGDPQLKIPLIGEVRQPNPDPPKRARRRTKKPIQPTLGDV